MHRMHSAPVTSARNELMNHTRSDEGSTDPHGRTNSAKIPKSMPSCRPKNSRSKTRRQSVRRAISACNGYLYEFPKQWSVSNAVLMDEIKRYKKTKEFDFSFLEKAIEWKDVETGRYLAWSRDSNELELSENRSNQTEFYMVALTEDI